MRRRRFGSWVLLLAFLLFLLPSTAEASRRGGAGGDYGFSNPQKTVHVGSYTTSNGTFVHEHWRRPPGGGSDRRSVGGGRSALEHGRAARVPWPRPPEGACSSPTRGCARRRGTDGGERDGARISFGGEPHPNGVSRGVSKGRDGERLTVPSRAAVARARPCTGCALSSNRSTRWSSRRARRGERASPRVDRTRRRRASRDPGSQPPRSSCRSGSDDDRAARARRDRHGWSCC